MKLGLLLSNNQYVTIKIIEETRSIKNIKANFKN